jgi:hypothetical protein
VRRNKHKGLASIAKVSTHMENRQSITKILSQSSDHVWILDECPKVFHASLGLNASDRALNVDQDASTGKKSSRNYQIIPNLTREASLHSI